MKSSLLIWGLLVVTLTAHADPRLWSHSGIPVRRANHIEWYGSTAQDAAGNTLIVWSDARSGNRDIYAQLVSPAGAAVWQEGGVNVTPSAPNVQQDPVVCATSGGWIVAWVEFRAATWGWIYDGEHLFGGAWAQKLDNNGNLLWPGNDNTGVPVDTAGVHIYCDEIDHPLAIAPDAAGGAYVCSGQYNDDVWGQFQFIQRVQSDGQPAWPAHLAIDMSQGGGLSIAAAGDGSGDLFAAWRARPNTGLNYEIRAARITPQSAQPWGTEGVSVFASDSSQGTPVICSGEDGGCFVAWYDSRGAGYDYATYAQRLNGDGQVLWTTSGVLVCDAPYGYGTSAIRIAPSRSGGVIDGLLLVWPDQRVNDYVQEIFAQKLTLVGTTVWPANGLRVCGDAQPSGEGHNRLGPSVCSDDEGGLVCAWDDYRNDNGTGQQMDIYAGRVSTSGALLWAGECGNLAADGLYLQSHPALTLTSSAAAVVYLDKRLDSLSLRYQSLDLASGSRLIVPGGMAILDGQDGDAYKPQTVAMSGNRIAVVWQNRSTFSDNTSLYYQIVGSDGRMELAENGVRLVTSANVSAYTSLDSYRLCPDGTGGFFCTLLERSTGLVAVRLVHVNSAGTVVTDPDGVVINDSDAMSDAYTTYCAPDGAGGCFVAWSWFNTSYYLDVFVTRVNGTGQPLWTEPLRLTDSSDDDVLTGLVATPDSACALVWTSGGYPNTNISAAKVGLGRDVRYQLTLCDAPFRQQNATLIPDADGEGGLFLAWEDRRTQEQCPSCLDDLFGQHLDALGNETWPHNGATIVVQATSQISPQLSTDAEDHLLVAWLNQSTGPATAFDLFAQRLDASGQPVWPQAMGFCQRGRERWDLAIISDRGAGIFAAWADGGDSPFDGITNARATHIGPDGTPIGDDFWTADTAGALCDWTHTRQQSPSLAPDGSGGFFAVWQDERASRTDAFYACEDLYVQRCVESAGAHKAASSLPQVYSLSQNYPNPFNPATRIAFALPREGQTTLKVFDLLGRDVATLMNRPLPAGEHAVTFNAAALSSGVYFYRLQSGSFTATRKLVLLK